ncbi:MAG TPA: glycosyltransferase family 39 protein [Candidatus Methylomirabilis sp.]|nr:glycosyltransferase family 39 protein [Candidatus Methylomirabilis sp.]
MTAREILRWTSLAVCLGLLLIFGRLWIRAIGGTGPYDYDEGVYLISARLTLHGQPLYVSVFNSQPPAFLQLLAVAFRVFGDTLTVGRATSIAFAVLALSCVAGIAWRLFGAAAAPLALLAMGLAYVFFKEAVTVRTGLPALALGLLAIALLAGRARLSRWAYLASGAAFALGTLCKLFVLPMLVPLLVLLVVPFSSVTEPGAALDEAARAERPGTPRASRLLFFGLGGSLASLLVLWPVDLPAAYAQAVGFHLRASTAFGIGLDQKLRMLSLLLGGEIGVAILATMGMAALWRANVRAALWLAAWLAATGIFLAVHVPLWGHHAAIFLPPLALAASASVLWRSSLPPGPWRWSVLVLFLVPLVAVDFYVRPTGGVTWRLRWSAERDVTALAAVQRAALLEEEAIALIRRHTSREHLVVSDQQLQLFLADREPPPALVDTSLTRIASGSLTDQAAIDVSEHARMIVFWTGRLERLTEFARWVRARFVLVYRSDRPSEPSREIYVRE